MFSRIGRMAGPDPGCVKTKDGSNVVLNQALNRALSRKKADLTPMALT
jgi:hypothetical protein